MHQIAGIAYFYALEIDVTQLIASQRNQPTVKPPHPEISVKIANVNQRLIFVGLFLPLKFG